MAILIDIGVQKDVLPLPDFFTLVVMTRIRKILDEKTAFFVHVSLGAILCDFLKSILRVFSLGSMKEDFIIL